MTISGFGMEGEGGCGCRPRLSAWSGAAVGSSGRRTPSLGSRAVGAGPGKVVQPNRVMDFGPYRARAECSSSIGSEFRDPIALNPQRFGERRSRSLTTPCRAPHRSQHQLARREHSTEGAPSRFVHARSRRREPAETRPRTPAALALASVVGGVLAGPGRACRSPVTPVSPAPCGSGCIRGMPSGLDGSGESARDLARRLRSFAVLKVFQQHELARGLALPDDEIEL